MNPESDSSSSGGDQVRPSARHVPLIPPKRVVPSVGPVSALAELERRVRAELALLAYPDRAWVVPRSGPAGEHVHDVVLVGAGQCGLSLAFALRRAGVTNIAVLDGCDEGSEGPWTTVARMTELRTPKHQIGIEGGVASLALPQWYEAVYGAEAWQSIERVPRSAWIEYLRWFRRMTSTPVANNTTATSVEPGAELVSLEVRDAGGARRMWARHVVLCTGWEGGGSWYIPEHIAAAVPPEAVVQANLPYDVSRLRGLRVGVLGNGASAFDAAAAALDAGACSVDLCFRRAALPQVNPHRCVEYRGFLDHYADLDDLTRWRVASHFDRGDQPPALDGYRRAIGRPGFRMHAAANWQQVRWQGAWAEVDTGTERFAFDALVCATGMRVELGRRPELAALEAHVARWQDRFQPPPGEEHDGLAAFPYLGTGYELLGRDPEAAGLDRVLMFNGASFVSCGPHSTSISALGSSVPRVTRHLTRRLMREQAGSLLAELAAYDVADPLPEPDPTARGDAARTFEIGVP